MRGSFGRSLAVCLLTLVGAAAVNSSLLRLVGRQRSTWVRVTLAEGSATAPPCPCLHFNFDSLGYYAFGRNLWFQRTLDACRTPGYPMLIALSRRVA